MKPFSPLTSNTSSEFTSRVLRITIGRVLLDWMAPTSKQRALFNPFNACLLGGLSCHIKKMVWRRNRQESRGIDVSGVCARGFELQTCAACKQRFIFYVLGLDRRVLFFFLSFCCVRIVETGGDLT